MGRLGIPVMLMEKGISGSEIDEGCSMSGHEGSKGGGLEVTGIITWLLTPKRMASFGWLRGPERVIWYVEVGGVIGTLDRCGG